MKKKKKKKKDEAQCKKLHQECFGLIDKYIIHKGMKVGLFIYHGMIKKLLSCQSIIMVMIKIGNFCRKRT
jgi:hypothetical protein